MYNRLSKHEELVNITGPVGKLEAILSIPDSENITGIVMICHPNPQQEGTMYNKVVTTLARGFHKLGFASIRFNYRGVGNSEGSYGNVTGEIKDAECVVNYLLDKYPKQKLWLAGFSFGSYIAASISQMVDAVGLILVAPAVGLLSFNEFTWINERVYVIQGDSDEVVDAEAVGNWVKQNNEIKLKILPGAGHFFHGRLIEIEKIVLDVV